LLRTDRAIKFSDTKSVVTLLRTYGALFAWDGMKILGILNVTTDSFTDGGKYLRTDAALAHANNLLAEGADVIDIGAASSHPDAAPIPPQAEIARLAPIIPVLHDMGASLSIDSFRPEVQAYALEHGVDYLNDIHGFPDPALYPGLAASSCKLIVMHMVQAHGQATRLDVAPGEIMDRILAFFEGRIAALTAAGIARERLILDPGMGFFLSTDPQTSLAVLGRLPELAQAFGLPLLVSVSRKSFLKALARSGDRPQDPSVAAEMFAIAQGADYIRTHAPAPLREGLKILESLGPGGD
jgi:dihydropteroate synthase type 2